jgi:hypothetical protein
MVEDADSEVGAGGGGGGGSQGSIEIVHGYGFRMQFEVWLSRIVQKLAPHRIGDRCGANSGTISVLSLGRALVGSVGVSLTDLAVFPMDEHFAALVFGDSTGGFDGGALGACYFGGVACTGGFDCPTLRVWDDVLVSFHWLLFLLILLFAHKMQ